MRAKVAFSAIACKWVVAWLALVMVSGCVLKPRMQGEPEVAHVDSECRGDILGMLNHVPHRTDGSSPRSCGDTLRFYEPFAAMAAAIYDPRDRTEEQLATVAGSSWLLHEVMHAGPSEPEVLRTLLNPDQRKNIYLKYIGRGCAGQKADWTASAHNGAVLAAQGQCRDKVPESPKLTAWYDIFASPDDDEREVHDAHSDSSDGLDEDEPAGWQQCDSRDAKHQPTVPVKAMTAGWHTVPELQRRMHPRGWSLFVPGLVIDVWRREPSALGESPEVEYALVFRGTADGGGWLSNFRALTAVTPVVWDQYRQAQRATTDLVNQIYQLHAFSDALFDRHANTRIKITAVGHSLGGGLAQYVFLRVPQITRVVAFDPSPVNGSAKFSPTPVDEKAKARGRRDRESVLGPDRQPLDLDKFDDQASILVLYEQGDVLTKLAGCASGPIWGDEGGPRMRCDSVNLSGGSAISQHNMPQLACKMRLALRGLRTR